MSAMNKPRKPSALLRPLGPYRLPITIGVIFVLVCSLSRIVLIALHAGSLGSTAELSQLLLWGLRIDLQTMGILVAPALLITLLFHHHATVAVWRPLIVAYFAAFGVLIALLELSTPDFIAEYGVRPNRLFFEYLSNPREVFSMLAVSRPGILFGGAAFAFGLGALLVWRLLVHTRYKATHSLATVLWFLPALVICFAVARGTAGHRALNPASAAVTNSQTLNDIALNSLYSVGYALYALKNEDGMELRYGDMPPERALELVRGGMAHVPTSAYVDDRSTHHWQNANGKPRYRNFVLILEESLGAEFVGRLGGLPLTPNLDALADEGWWFDQMYATGTRSVRGIEAVTTGFLPSPARAVVKLPGAQHDFYTIGRTLGDAGWATTFVYGGDANFDNMRRFLSNNGFQTVIENRDFSDDVERTTWGVADEHVLMRVHTLLSAAPSDQPQFVLAFSSTNHEPFEVPPGHIENYAEPALRVENAVKYADWSIGQFFDAAKQSSYWDDTLFLVVADHNSRVYGDGLIPIDRFHIPALFVGHDVTPRVHNQVASQLDLPVTSLALLDVSAEHPMVGRDLTKPYEHGRAIMQFRDNQAYMQDDAVVVLRPDLTPTTWSWDGAVLRSKQTDTELTDLALAHAKWARHSYQNQLYRPPAAPIIRSASVAVAAP